METVLGIVALIAFLLLVIKVCISTKGSENNSVTKLIGDTLQNGNIKEESHKVNDSVSLTEHPSVTEHLSDVLVNSPYYNKYKTTFDYIRYYGKEPKYRVDWLLKSLDMGHELEYNGVFVTESINKNFPYFCETEEEFEQLSKDDASALKGSVDAIWGLGYLYYESNTKTFLQEKRDYWRNQIIEMANSGNLDARAGLCRKNLLFTEQEIVKYKEKYESELLQMAESGNPHAQLAVGKFIAKNRNEKIEWLNNAGEQGLSDAYYYLATVYSQMRFMDDEFNFKQITLDEKEVQVIDGKIGECYLKGANLNKGMMASECQCNLADAYRQGHYGFEKDLANARYWYEIAFKNGKVHAGRCVEEIDKYGE